VRRLNLLLSVVAVTVALGLTAAPAPAVTRLASYCSPTGDYCQGVFRSTSGSVFFQLRTFSFRGTVQTCVARRTRVCRGRVLRRIGSIHQATISWRGNYPPQGPGRYAVSWYAGGAKIGRTLYFTR
jgi:hypothetical protein